MKLSITESLPPQVIAEADEGWDDDILPDRWLSVSGSIDVCINAVPSLRRILQIIDEDATNFYQGDARLVHRVEIASGKSVPQGFPGHTVEDLLQRPQETTRASAWHLDVEEKSGIKYLLSNMVHTEHLLGRFVTLGATNNIQGISTAMALAVQARHALWFQADPNQIIRINNTNVHRSPQRCNTQESGQHVFVSDFVTNG